MEEVMTEFCGKVVLVTGAAGSIGSELCRQLAQMNIKKLIMPRTRIGHLKEALQKEVCYPDYDKHHAKHEEFKQTIQELNEMLQEEEGPSDAFVQKVEEHVVKWFYRHISSFDRSVAEYINMRENGGRL